MAEIPDDRRLVILLQKGNVAAFDSLFEVYSQKLFGFALRYFKNEADAEELVQDVFVKVWENRHSLKSGLSFRSYLFTIALNQIRAHFNKKAVSLRYIQRLQNDGEMLDDSAITDDNYESVLQQIRQIIDQMPPRKRDIFIKSKLEGKHSKEIAAELDISPGTVDNQVSEALRFVRARVNGGNLGLLVFAILFIN